MKQVHIPPPTPAGPPGQTQIAPPAPGDKRAVRRILWTFGFQALAVLLGIALIFM
jgi:hypothetical protein